ncbi:MAG TPA: response regulator [Burkholderiaceae bacterium]|jgi:CheY-like chemotaxis protein|nr:response regulator [Burkholderiaceae bacterium]
MKSVQSEMRQGLPGALAGGAGRFEPDIASCRALVIDANPTARSIQAAQLRDLGVGSIVQCGRVQDARRQLETHEFDIVLCEQDFHGGNYSGQDLLNDLRRAQLLPFSTVFVMVTSEARYAAVAEAAESALDSYLLKPHTAQALGERIQQARHRKKVLKDIFVAVDAGQFDLAAQLCMRRFEVRGAYWLYAARIGAELLLRLDRHDDARVLYEAVIATQALPWARLGVARAQIESGATPDGRRTLESLIADQPGFADAYDVMGRVQVDQGQFAEALATYRTATQLTPGSIARLQRQGMLAFYLGESDEAGKALERATLMGISSKMFDFQTIVLLAVTRFTARDSKGLQRCLDNMRHALEKSPHSVRLRRFMSVITVFNLMLQRQVAQVVAEVRAMAEDIRQPDFDFEAASNLVAMLSYLTAAELQLDAVDGWIDTLALRFCTTRSLSELLARAGQAHAPFATRIREQHNAITALAEQAISHSLAGEPRAAAKQLLGAGARTMNAKLIDMARMVLTRHADKIADAGDLMGMADELRQRYVTASAVAPLTADNGRQSGGLVLRAREKDGGADGVAPAPAPVAADAPTSGNAT